MATILDSSAKEIKSDFPFISQFVEVNHAKIHYIEQGEGNPFVFIHGVPTWSYIWRNIIPTVARVGRCVASDLIGMGKSEKPNIDYHLADYIDYFSGFMEKLQLHDVYLVMHGWGSVIGFCYAMLHPSMIKGLIFMESYLRPITNVEQVSLAAQELANLAKQDDLVYDLVIRKNIFLTKILPGITLRKLNPIELACYVAPFHKMSSRKLLLQYLMEQPFVNEESPAIPVIKRYSNWLQKSSLPKLMFYGLPGLLTTMDDVQWAQDHLSNFSLIDIGNGLHNLPECSPFMIANEIVNWYEQLK